MITGQETDIRTRQVQRRANLTWRNSFDLLLLCGLGAILPVMASLWVNSPLLAPLTLLKLLVGVVATLLAPGFAFTAALLPSRRELDLMARAALSIGVSIACVAMLTMVLGVGRSGIWPQPVAFSLTLWIEFFGTIAIWRRLGLAESYEHPWLPEDTRFIMRRPITTFDRRLSAGSLALLALAAFASLTVLSIDRVARTTEFYMLGAEGQAEYYPRDAKVGQELTVTIGITNRERRTHSYRIEIWTGRQQGAIKESPSQELLAVSTDNITLRPGETREQAVTWRMRQPGPNQAVQLILLTADDDLGRTDPYRQLELWMDVGEALQR